MLSGEMMEFLVMLGIVLVFLMMFFDFICEWEIPGGLYMVLIFGYVIFHAIGSSPDEPVSQPVPTEQTQTQTQALMDENKQEIQQLKEATAVEMAEIKADLVELNEEVVAEASELTSTDNGDNSNNNVAVVATIVVFVLVWIFSESVIIAVFVASLCFSFLGENLTIDVSQTDTDEPSVLKQVDTSRRKYETEYMSNRLRSKTPVYLYKDSGDTVATSDPTLRDNAIVIFHPKRLVKHTTGQLYACKTSKLCYPVNVYE